MMSKVIFFFHQFSRRGKEIFKKNQFDSLVLVYSGIFPNSSWYSALRQSWQHCILCGFVDTVGHGYGIDNTVNRAIAVLISTGRYVEIVTSQ
jgi:hypothetical protein